MDFDIGNILYIVITLVAVIIGLLGKKKKPAGGDPAATESAAQPGFLENLERMLTMDQEPVRVTGLQDYEEDLPAEEILTGEAVEESFAEWRSTSGMMEEYERIMNRDQDKSPGSRIPESRYNTEPLELIELDEVSGTNYFELIRDFDAGAAVVYSAIINRLDY